MTKTATEKPSDLVETVRALPDQVQVSPVDGLADFTDADLSDAQRAEIDRRLVSPRYAEPVKVREFFSRLGVSNG